MHGETYTKSFFSDLRNGAARSADAIIPVLLKLVSVKSVVDVGCGQGTWLAAFQRFGVEDILGVDGDYVDRSALEIPGDCFKALDLLKRFELGRTFDLAVSLEVAEHLDAGSAEGFVASITELAPVVLFSAAIPFQGGVHHVNEQWPDVWVSLFSKFGFVAIDCIRRHVWENDAVEWWYAQNSLIFARGDALESIPVLKREFEDSKDGQIRLVHPRNYGSALRPLQPPDWRVGTAARLLLVCMQNAVRRRMLALRGPVSYGEVRNPPNFNAAVGDSTLYGIVRRPGRE